jgi:hypothetical protein
MFSVSRSLKRTIPLVRQRVQNIRKMSGHSVEEHEKEVSKWIKMSIGKIIYFILYIIFFFLTFVFSKDYKKRNNININYILFI